MFCPSCGTQQQLSYCTRCGVNLNFRQDSDESQPLEQRIESTVWALVVATIAILGIMIGVMAVMKNVVGLGQGYIIGAVGLIFALLLGIDGMLIWQIIEISQRRSGGPSLFKEPPRGLDTKTLHDATEHLLDRRVDEPAVRAVEDPTRTFEPASPGNTGEQKP